MSIRMSLLALVDEAPAHGYQLRQEFEHRTGGAWPVNVGQVYTTLERLDRDALVTKATDDEGRTVFAITPAGHAAVAEWLRAPAGRSTPARDELAMKLAIAATLPAVDIADVLQVQRSAAYAHLQELTRAKGAAPEPRTVDDLAGAMIIDAMVFQTEAEVAWLDHTEQRIAAARAAGLPRRVPAAAPTTSHVEVTR